MISAVCGWGGGGKFAGGAVMISAVCGWGRGLEGRGGGGGA